MTDQEKPGNTEDSTNEGNKDHDKLYHRPDPVVLLLEDNMGIVLDRELGKILHEQSYFGKKNDSTGFLHLYPEEIMIFSERNRLLALKDLTLEDAIEINQQVKLRWQETGIDGFTEDNRFLDNESLFKYFQEHESEFWEKYMVYRDLKTRGYIVRRGIEDIANFRVYKKGARKGLQAAKFIYFGVFEGKPISLFKLQEISEYAFNNRKELILAVVDRHQDITYYNIKQQQL